MVVVIGELAGDIGAFTYEGLSPRMRGTFAPCRAVAAELGIIPAYAGNTRRAGSWSDCYRDHPRVCGEHSVWLEFRTKRKGSSPRMRGTPSFVREHCGVWGIIPAYAGNTHWNCSPENANRDHPRVCGEHPLELFTGKRQPGSSPRMRGTLLPVFFRRISAGIIPAYAGNTPTTTITAPTARDHPRVCGEHVCHSTPFTLTAGSSPRMRGTPAYSCPLRE